MDIDVLKESLAILLDCMEDEGFHKSKYINVYGDLSAPYRMFRDYMNTDYFYFQNSKTYLEIVLDEIKMWNNFWPDTRTDSQIKYILEKFTNE